VGWIGTFVESLLPNYVAAFLPSREMLETVAVLWLFLAFLVGRWCLRRAKGQRNVILPIAMIGVSLLGLLVGAVWLVKITAPTQLAAQTSDASKPAFDLGGNADIVAGDIKLCGEMTIVKSQPGSGGSLQLHGFTGIAPNTKCSFPPPTEAMKGLSNKELRQRVAALCEALNAFQKSSDNQETFRLNDQQRRALDQSRKDEFKSRYLEQAMLLNNAIAARIGWAEIPETKPNEANVMKAQMWSTLPRHGRATLIFGKPIGLEPATSVSNYLAFIVERLPE